MTEKRASLTLIPVLFWIGIVYVVIWPWMQEIDHSQYGFSALAHLNAGIWWLVLLWSFHHLAFQVWALLKSPERPRKSPSTEYTPSVAVLYMTCDDFDEEACRSCLSQDYEPMQLYILDDSNDIAYQKRLQSFEKDNPSCRRLTRPSRRGFKAGNINHALEHHIDEEWLLLVDADQYLPADYLRRLTATISSTPDDDLLFIQGAQEALWQEDSTLFQGRMGPEVSLFYKRDMPWRERFGFVPLLGHGALVRVETCCELGGFPEVVSEDFALALRAARAGKRGHYVPNVESSEAYPHDMGAFLTRLRKFAAGSAELIRKELGPFLTSSISWVEKWDFCMAMMWYVLMPLLVANAYLSAYVVHILWSTRFPYIHPWLPYVYTWLLLVVLALCASVTRTWKDAVHFYFWSSAVYSAVLPLCSWAFVKHLFVAANFSRTPKEKQHLTRIRVADISLSGVLGGAALVLAFRWWSPFSPVLVGQGVAFMSLGLYTRLCSTSMLGRLARVLVYLPGVFYLVGLVAVWLWARV